MQRVCRVVGGVNEYRRDPDCLVCDETRKCPLCKDGHRLRLHGWYMRQALFASHAEAETIAVRRLLCVHTGATVSLLPDFCIPARQYGPEILGWFVGWLLRGLGQLAALREVRPTAAWHSVARSLLAGFRRRQQPLKTYLALRSPRVIEYRDDHPPGLGQVAQLFAGLTAGFPDPALAFTFHGVLFHRRFSLGLA